MRSDSSLALYEFFAGGGLARLGLEGLFRCAFANDWDPLKARAYRAAFGGADFVEADVWTLGPEDLPGRAALAWASFPCQDLSLAGARSGLNGARSGAFWGFWRLMEALAAEGRAPECLVLENVAGLLTSHQGRDFSTVIATLARAGYAVGALTLDAAWFTPHSRPRLFIVASRRAPASLTCAEPCDPIHSAALRAAVARLDPEALARWVWWRLPEAPQRNTHLRDIIDADAPWRPEAETAALLALMHPRQRLTLQKLQADGREHFGAVFRRMRIEDGRRVQRAEARFDGVAGCLRTPAGGSSRQIVMRVEGADIRTRLLSPREAARLMGAPDDFPLPARTNEALKLFGDGVCAPLAAWLGAHLLRPLAAQADAQKAA